MAIRFSNGFIMGAQAAPNLSFFTDLGVIASHLRNYMSDFKNPNFYSYLLDGDGFFIQDGEGDMYDDGNVTTPWLISNQTYSGNSSYDINTYPYAVNYQTTVNPGTEDASFGYLSLGYNNPTYLPLTVIGTRATIASPGDPIGFQCGGNSGADGQGSHIEGNIYSGNTVSGFTVHAYYSETYNAGDPSTCSVFILLGHPDWNSVFGDVFYGGDPNTQGNGAFLYTSGGGAQNVLAIKTLLSKDNGVEVTFSEVNDVVNNFIARISETLSNVPTPTSTASVTPTSTPTPTPTSTPSFYQYGGYFESEYSIQYDACAQPLVDGVTLYGSTPTFSVGDTLYKLSNFSDPFINGAPGYYIKVTDTYNDEYILTTDTSGVITELILCSTLPTPTPTPTGTSTPMPTSTSAPNPTPTPTTTGGAGIGAWYFYSNEGTLDAGPPVANGNAIFLINGSPKVETFNPNKSNGVNEIYFNLDDSNGTNYTTQFTALQTNGGTISITQGANTVTYTSTTPGTFFVESMDGFFIIQTGPATQTVTSANPFVFGDPISLSFS